MMILAVDPGGTTGWASLTPDGFEAGFDADWLHFCQMVSDHPPDICVVEKFTITTQTAKLTRCYDPLYIIGTLLFFAKRDGFRIVFQTPSEAKTFSTNEKLKRINWYTTNDHARDAARHLLLYAVRSGLITGRDLIDGESISNNK